jgi:vancomycin resistance protein YoaR
VNALFQFENGKVAAFRPSSVGHRVNQEKIGDILLIKAPTIFLDDSVKAIIIPVSVDTIEPNLSTDKANNLGIKELIGSGTSLFRGSIENRIYNITLASSRLNGILVLPNETFSFNKALGDISSFTGYKQAYVIENGRTVLGDGGGVCQVSTTFFRALLNSGLPIAERTAHAYRVGYYEQDSPAGIDATIFVPTVDLKFKNDTSNHILVQTSVDPQELRLTVYLYGTKDGRIVTVTAPVVTNQVAPPPPAYQDDPTLSQGVVKQVDFEAWGATAQFSREVKKDGKVIISEKFTSNYRPWRAVFLKGTKT